MSTTARPDFSTWPGDPGAADGLKQRARWVPDCRRAWLLADSNTHHPHPTPSSDNRSCPTTTPSRAARPAARSADGSASARHRVRRSSRVAPAVAGGTEQRAVMSVPPTLASPLHVDGIFDGIPIVEAASNPALKGLHAFVSVTPAHHFDAKTLIVLAFFISLAFHAM